MSQRRSRIAQNAADGYAAEARICALLGEFFENVSPPSGSRPDGGIDLSARGLRGFEADNLMFVFQVKTGQRCARAYEFDVGAFTTWRGMFERHPVFLMYLPRLDAPEGEIGFLVFSEWVLGCGIHLAARRGGARSAIERTRFERIGSGRHTCFHDALRREALRATGRSGAWLRTFGDSSALYPVDLAWVIESTEGIPYLPPTQRVLAAMQETAPAIRAAMRDAWYGRECAPPGLRAFARRIKERMPSPRPNSIERLGVQDVTERLLVYGATGALARVPPITANAMRIWRWAAGTFPEFTKMCAAILARRQDANGMIASMISLGEAANVGSGLHLNAVADAFASVRTEFRGAPRSLVEFRLRHELKRGLIEAGLATAAERDEALALVRDRKFLDEHHATYKGGWERRGTAIANARTKLMDPTPRDLKTLEYHAVLLDVIRGRPPEEANDE